MTTDFAVFDVGSGEFLYSGSAPDIDQALAQSSSADQAVIIGAFSSGVHYLRGDGQVYQYTSDELVAKAGPRYCGSQWSNVDMTWHDTRDVNQAKTDAWASIKAERESRLGGTFTHDGNTYDIDPTNLAGASIDAREALIAGESAWSQMWVLADNTVAILSATEMIAVGRACKAVVSDLWATSQLLRGLIDTATTIEEVEAIAWP